MALVQYRALPTAKSRDEVGFQKVLKELNKQNDVEIEGAINGMILKKKEIDERRRTKSYDTDIEEEMEVKYTDVMEFEDDIKAIMEKKIADETPKIEVDAEVFEYGYTDQQPTSLSDFSAPKTDYRQHSDFLILLTFQISMLSFLKSVFYTPEVPGQTSDHFLRRMNAEQEKKIRDKIRQMLCTESELKDIDSSRKYRKVENSIKTKYIYGRDFEPEFKHILDAHSEIWTRKIKAEARSRGNQRFSPRDAERIRDILISKTIFFFLVVVGKVTPAEVQTLEVHYRAKFVRNWREWMKDVLQIHWGKTRDDFGRLKETGQRELRW
ncbi:MAG: hypothetical protein Q9220_001836 [cf. Caloplaca sp. 1 TL-2023]